MTHPQPTAALASHDPESSAAPLASHDPEPWPPMFRNAGLPCAGTVAAHGPKYPEVVRSGLTGLWVHVPSLLRDWRATYDKRSESTEEQLIETLNTPDVLVLDEVGADRADRSDWSLDQISMLIDERYRDGGAIVVTGNVSDLAAGIGGRGADRFDEMGVVIAMVGPSYRSKAADDPALQVPDDFTEPPARIEWTVCDAGVDRVEVRDQRPAGSQGRLAHQPLQL